MTEMEKMLSGKIYDSNDSELCRLRDECKYKTSLLNSMDNTKTDKQNEIIKKLLGSCGENVSMINVQFDYGFNTSIGNNFFANYNFVVLDCAKVSIGDNVLIGPNVTLATPVHPLLADERRCKYDENGKCHLYEYAKPINIGNDVWIASNVTVCAGVKIGDGAVIGAGSVVTKNVPAYTVAAGVPCKVIRKISEEDSVKELYCEG